MQAASAVATTFIALVMSSVMADISGSLPLTMASFISFIALIAAGRSAGTILSETHLQILSAPSIGLPILHCASSSSACAAGMMRMAKPASAARETYLTALLIDSSFVGYA